MFVSNFNSLRLSLYEKKNSIQTCWCFSQSQTSNSFMLSSYKTKRLHVCWKVWVNFWINRFTSSSYTIHNYWFIGYVFLCANLSTWNGIWFILYIHQCCHFKVKVLVHKAINKGHVYLPTRVVCHHVMHTKGGGIDT